VLGEAVAAAGEGATVLVLSDHGFRAAAPEDRVKRRRATTEGLRALLEAEVGPVDVARVGHKVTVSTLMEDPAAGVVALRAWLQAFRVEKTGLPLYRAEPVPGQPYALGLTLRADAFVPAELKTLTVQGHPLGDFVRLAPGQAGEHDPAGIAVLAGPGIEPGSLGEVSQLDVAPTVLSLLGIPAAADMTGRSWVEEAGPRVESYDALAPAQAPASQPAEVDEQQLRALGYVE
jgi:arylsulfatase A-like enzyme